MARKTEVNNVVYSKFKIKVLELLKQYSFVKGFEIQEDGNKKYLSVQLKPVINPVDDIPKIKFYSKPSRPWYVWYKEIKPVASGKGIGILSTNEWLLAAHVAKKRKLGGEFIAEIY